MAKLRVTKIPNMNTLVIRQSGGNYFIATKDALIIDIFGLSALLKFLLFSKMISPKVLRGILEEYDSYQALGEDWTKE